jgi:hypothetical protein
VGFVIPLTNFNEMMKVLNHFLILASLLLLIPSCKSVCDKVTCLNSGTCDEATGLCKCQGQFSGPTCDTLCPIGYEGSHCDTLSKTKFFGTWDCTVPNTSGGTTSFVVKIVDDLGPTNWSYMFIQNFNNHGYSVMCNMLGKKKFEINDQKSTGTSIKYQVSGSGQLQNDSTLIVYINEDGVNYQATCKRHK